MHWSFTLKFWCESSMYTEVLMWKFNVHWSFDVKVQCIEVSHWSFDVKVQCIEVSHWSFDLKVQCTVLLRLKFYIEVLTWKFKALNFWDWSFTLKFQTVVGHWNVHIKIFRRWPDYIPQRFIQVQYGQHSAPRGNYSCFLHENEHIIQP